MFNKKKCKTCKYHSRLSGMVGKSDPNSIQTIMCAYSLAKHSTCLRYLDADTTYDMRGDDPDHCLLYEKGKPPRTSVKLRRC